MSEFPYIVVPIDGSSHSKQALPYVRALAGHNSTIVLLQVIPGNQESGPLFMKSEFGWAEGEQLITAAQARESLQHLAAEWALADAQTGHPDVRVRVGDPAETILDMAQEHGSTLIVMATHGYGALKRVMFGSVADRIVRHSPVPVLMVRPQGAVAPGSTAAIQRIVVPLDGSARAEHALPMAVKLASQLHVPMLLVRALAVAYIVPAVEGAFAMTQETMDDTARLGEEYLARVRDRLMTNELNVSILTGWGAPFQVIDSAAEQDDLIVLTSHGRGGAKRWLLGSVSEKLIRASHSPILVVPTRSNT